MMKMGRKGFTLIELLAVVVVLAIVVGVTVPMGMSMAVDSKIKALTSSINEAEDYVADQWRIKKMDPNMMDSNFKSQFGSYSSGSGFIVVNKGLVSDMGLGQEMIIDGENKGEVEISISSDGKVCVVIRELPVKSTLYNAKLWKKISGTEYAEPTSVNDRYYSKSCDESRL